MLALHHRAPYKSKSPHAAVNNGNVQKCADERVYSFCLQTEKGCRIYNLAGKVYTSWEEYGGLITIFSLPDIKQILIEQVGWNPLNWRRVIALLSHCTTSALQELLPDELLDLQEKSSFAKSEIISTTVYGCLNTSGYNQPNQPEQMLVIYIPANHRCVQSLFDMLKLYYFQFHVATLLWFRHKKHLVYTVLSPQTWQQIVQMSCQKIFKFVAMNSAGKC